MTTDPSLPTPHTSPEADRVLATLQQHIAAELHQAGGWLGFDRFMELALYAPGLGYYANGSTKFGRMPQGTRASDGTLQGAGSDFVTAPEMTALFGYTLAQPLAQALQATGTFEIWEFGAGTGALALQLITALKAMGQRIDRYTIVDLSDSLKERQRHTLREHLDVVHWAAALPEAMQGVVVGNEVLDAMPVKLLARTKGLWHERGVVLENGAWAWSDRPTELRPPLDIEGGHDYLTEIHLQAEAFVRTLGDRLKTGAIFLLDYGFPEAEYYHPQRHMGTVMCHRAHQADVNPLEAVGLKDITAHVNFTGVAVAAQDAGLELLGYTSQAHFLMNCGIVELMQNASLPERVAAQKLILEHEMGEFFKVIGLVKGIDFASLGFSHGDRTHRL